MFTDRGLTIVFLFLFIVSSALFYVWGNQHGYNKRSEEIEYYIDNIKIEY